MSTIDSGLGWKCDSDYYFDTAQALVTFPNNNTISKANAGACLAAAFKNTSSPADYGVIMASPNSADLAALAKSGSITLATVTEVYDGVIWYVAWGYSTNTSYAQNESYHTQNLVLLDTPIPSGSTNRAQGLITESGFEFTAKKIPTTDFVKSFVEGVEAETAERVNANKAAIGTLSDLTTTEKTDLVAAINELESTKQPKATSKIITTTRCIPSVHFFEPVTWNGLTSFDGDNVWTDGDNIYYSYYSTQYVLDKTTSTWSTKTWNGMTSFLGYNIWSDGDNIYFADQYVLNKSNSTWVAKTWKGLTGFSGYGIWSDGNNIYYSYNNANYVLNKSTSTWSTKTWSGITLNSRENVWSDGDNIYYSNGSSQYVLNKSTSTWSTKTWNGLTGFYGRNIWTDGENIYHSDGTNNYRLSKGNSTWEQVFLLPSSLYGRYIWTDGENIYYSSGTTQYIILKTSQLSLRK